MIGVKVGLAEELTGEKVEECPVKLQKTKTELRKARILNLLLLILLIILLAYCMLKKRREGGKDG